MRHLVCGLAMLALLLSAAPGGAYDSLVEKKTFVMPSYTTVGGQAIKNVRVGYETYGTLNGVGDNVILICHFYSGNSHAAGKYKAGDAASGYWDAIIGAGKPIDTDKFFVVSSDTLANLNVKDPNTTLHAVMGASMGALQSYEWAAAYPGMVQRIVPVIGAPEIDAYSVGWLNIWAAPIMLDPKWNHGDYYGKDEPVEGLALALKTVTLHARHYGWAAKTFGRKWAVPDKDPAKSWDSKFAIEDVLDKVALARAKASDANSFLYLAKANQLFVTGHKGMLEDGLRDIRAKVLLVPAQSDLLLFPEYSKRAMAILRSQGREVEYFEIEGDGGHLDGVLAVTKAGEVIRKFLNQ